MASIKELISAVDEASRNLEAALRDTEAEHISAMENLFLLLETALENLKRSRQNFAMVARQVNASIDKMVEDMNYDAKVPKTCCAHEPDVADVPEQPGADVSQDLGDLGVSDPETREELEHYMAATKEIEEDSTVAHGETVEPSSVAPEETVEPSLVAPEETVEHEDAQQSD
jgi:hypothetical protein